MKISTKLFIAGGILFLLAFILPFTLPFAALCFVGGFVLLVFQGIMETISKNKPPKKDKKAAPPWEG